MPLVSAALTPKSDGPLLGAGTRSLTGQPDARETLWTGKGRVESGTGQFASHKTLRLSAAPGRTGESIAIVSRLRPIANPIQCKPRPVASQGTIRITDRQLARKASANARRWSRLPSLGSSPVSGRIVSAFSGDIRWSALTATTLRPLRDPMPDDPSVRLTRDVLRQSAQI